MQNAERDDEADDCERYEQTGANHYADQLFFTCMTLTLQSTWTPAHAHIFSYPIRRTVKSNTSFPDELALHSGRLALYSRAYGARFCIYQMNEMNFRNRDGHENSIINTVTVIITLLVLLLHRNTLAEVMFWPVLICLSVCLLAG